MTNSNPFLYILLSLVFLMSCGDHEPQTQIEIQNPTNYEFTRDGTSTVNFSGQTTRISMAAELVSSLSDLHESEASLLEMYGNQTAEGEDADPFSDLALNESTKSVKSKVAASQDFFASNSVESAQIKTDLESWIKAQVSEINPYANQLAVPGTPGQIADGSKARYVNAKGLEYNQAFTKSLIGALMVDQILNNYLSTAVLDAADNIADNNSELAVEGKAYTAMEHKWDEAYGYIFGADGADFTDPLTTLGSDIFLNKYLSRVNNDSDFEGIASDIYEAFKLGRAAIVANDYSIRNEQANIIKLLISEVIAVRAVYYLQQGKIAIENNDMGGAFHDLSEGFGFVYSLRFTRQANSEESYFTKSEVDGFTDQLLAGNGFWDIDSQTLDQISVAIASKFDFSVEQAGS